MHDIESQLRDERYERERLQTELAQERQARRSSFSEVWDALRGYASQDDVDELATKVNAMVLLLRGKAFSDAKWKDALRDATPT